MWNVETFSSAVDDEIRGLPVDMRARLVRLSDLIEAHGIAALPANAIKHLEGKLWELRITGKDGIARAIYITASQKRVIILRVFVKKTQKTPPFELEIARKRAKEIT